MAEKVLFSRSGICTNELQSFLLKLTSANIWHAQASELDFLMACCKPGMRAGRDLVNMAKKRPNVIPIIEDARHPAKYRMLVPMVDVIFADVAQPDQVRETQTCEFDAQS